MPLAQQLITNTVAYVTTVLHFPESGLPSASWNQISNIKGYNSEFEFKDIIQSLKI